jgi:hypothetical protein
MSKPLAVLLLILLMAPACICPRGEADDMFC